MKELIVKKNDAGQRLDRFVKMLKANGHQFITYNEFVDKVI